MYVSLLKIQSKILRQYPSVLSVVEIMACLRGSHLEAAKPQPRRKADLRIEMAGRLKYQASFRQSKCSPKKKKGRDGKSELHDVGGLLILFNAVILDLCAFCPVAVCTFHGLLSAVLCDLGVQLKPQGIV
jgi:hypothetical protein